MLSRACLPHSCIRSVANSSHAVLRQHNLFKWNTLRRRPHPWICGNSPQACLCPPRQKLADIDTAVTPTGVKALVSIGGWIGGLYYSSNAATAKNRTNFVKTVTKFASKYKLDGIDFECVALMLYHHPRMLIAAGSIRVIRELVRSVHFSALFMFERELENSRSVGPRLRLC
jgi:hypothetical protein